MLIKVTQKDIDKGLAGSSCSCPIAWAIKRASKKRKVDVFYRQAIFGADCIHGLLPSEAQEFIKSFDNYGTKAVTPFEFELEVL